MRKLPTSFNQIFAQSTINLRRIVPFFFLSFFFHSKYIIMTGQRLSGKVAIVTGAAGGIGFETAVLFAKHGAKVVCADVNETGAQKTVAKITQMVGEGVSISFKADVSKEDQVKALVDKAVDTYGNVKKKRVFFYRYTQKNLIGKLDIMFNNAGIMHPEDDNALNTEERIW
jgi:NAD(P)-dependent dehydrogenase (short-subunit alcohol dehydrogenase family)